MNPNPIQKPTQSASKEQQDVDLLANAALAAHRDGATITLGELQHRTAGRKLSFARIEALMQKVRQRLREREPNIARDIESAAA